MADTSRKRSRKSKLVPRECFIGEDELVLQLHQPDISETMKHKTKRISIPPEKTTTKPVVVCNTNILQRINAATRDDRDDVLPSIIKKTSPRKFEVDIQVESCDDEDDNGELYHLTPINKNPITKKVLRPMPITLSLDLVLDAADKILETSTSIADKYLDIYVRNTVGFEDTPKLVLNNHEARIQTALVEWRKWQFRSFHREEPLFYKCYICTRSWWYLSDFRDHMARLHGDDTSITIVLEKYEMHEINLIAYHKRLVVIKDIYTEGLCYRCGKDYAAHELSLRHQEKFYKNEGCTREFFCCMGLRDHLPGCPLCKVQDKPFKCDICRSRFDSQDEIGKHLILSHSVRSDIPIMTRYKVCKRCSERFMCGYVHRCAQKGPLLECPNCFQYFLNAKSLELHLKHSIKGFSCKVCGAEMTFSCKIYEHMLTHTDNYMIVRKCLPCDGLNIFINKEDAVAHRSLKHENTKHQKYYPKLLVPSSCVYKRLAESESIQLELLPIEHVSVPEEEISVPEEEISVPEEKISVPEKSVPVTNRELVPANKRTDAPDYIMDNVIVKEEPEDLDDSPILVIKEEPIDDFQQQTDFEENGMEHLGQLMDVKDEFIEEVEIVSENYHVDVDIEDLLPKEEFDEDTESVDIQEMENDGTSKGPPQPLAGEESVSNPDDLLVPPTQYTKSYRCKKCGFTAAHKEYKHHISKECKKFKGKSKYMRQSYSCSKCDKVFPNMKRYLIHFQEHGYDYMCCPECLCRYPSYTALGNHVYAHVKHTFIRVKKITESGSAISNPDYKCKKCGKVSQDIDFFQHWELHINANPSHPMMVTSRPQTSQKHGELHETIIKDCIAQLSKFPKECNHCHHKFNRINECKRHIIEHLLADAYTQKHLYKELKCQICDSGFPVPEKYKQHMRDHASLPVYKCELCDRTFSDSSNFTKHKKVHNLKVLVCDICNKKFQSKLSLSKHIEKHETTKPITCKPCNKVFFFQSAYRRHEKYFHEKMTIGFRCVICNERFESLKTKWDHMWEVHNERKQKADCPICHRSFRKYSDVRAHAKTDHLMEVSVISVKDTKKININRYLKSAASIKVGRVETLVVYDSE